MKHQTGAPEIDILHISQNSLTSTSCLTMDWSGLGIVARRHRRSLAYGGREIGTVTKTGPLYMYGCTGNASAVLRYPVVCDRSSFHLAPDQSGANVNKWDLDSSSWGSYLIRT